MDIINSLWAGFHWYCYTCIFGLFRRLRESSLWQAQYRERVGFFPDAFPFILKVSKLEFPVGPPHTLKTQWSSVWQVLADPSQTFCQQVVCLLNFSWLSKKPTKKVEGFYPFRKKYKMKRNDEKIDHMPQNN